MRRKTPVPEFPVQTKLSRALAGERQAVPPIWLMRQAGRYLPEYRAVRAKARDFLELCYTPDMAVEVTLQPIRRYGFDASIVFSDILVIPHALGQGLRFVEGEGPVLDALAGPADLPRLSADRLAERLGPVYETLARVRAALPSETALLGFAGAPFTLATYMVEGRGGTEHLKVKRWLYGDPQSFARLVDTLCDAVVDHLARQIDAGADAVQLFDSWAGVLPETQLRRWSVEPMARIAKALKARRPAARVIAFPRAVGPALRLYRDAGAFDALSVDTGIGAGWAASKLQPKICVQGNLDPVALLAGGAALESEARTILAALGGGPFVFNLGHGVLQHTPPENVARLVEIVRGAAS